MLLAVSRKIKENWDGNFGIVSLPVSKLLEPTKLAEKVYCLSLGRLNVNSKIKGSTVQQIGIF